MDKKRFHYYFLNINLSSTNSQDLKPGPRILKVKKGLQFPVLEDAEGPFYSLRNLKRNSIKLKLLKSTNSKRASTILKDKWIVEINNNGVFANSEKGFPLGFIKMIEHSIKGEIKKGKVNGVHYYNEDKVEIIKIINENKLGVFEAKIKVLDSINNKWIIKDSSSFFPKEWDLHRVFHECKYAYYSHKHTLIEGKQNSYLSYTESGVKVVIVKIEEEIKTIYPVV